MARKHRLTFSAADIATILTLVRGGRRVVIKSWGRGDRAYVWRRDRYYLEETEDGGLQSEEVLTEDEMLAAIARKPEYFYPLTRTS